MLGLNRRRCRQVVIPNVFPLELLDEVRSTIEDSDKGIRTLSSQHRHSDRYQGDHMFVGWSEEDRAREGDIQDECFARLIACPGMIQALHRCGAAAPAFQTCSVMSKPPSAPPLYWHQVGTPPLSVPTPSLSPPLSWCQDRTGGSGGTRSRPRRRTNSLPSSTSARPTARTAASVSAQLVARSRQHSS